MKFKKGDTLALTKCGLWCVRVYIMRGKWHWKLINSRHRVVARSAKSFKTMTHCRYDALRIGHMLIECLGAIA